jgi:hypothetical protein
MDQMHSIELRAYATGNIIHYTVEGSSPENYLPEPHSLKSIDRLPNENELCKVWMADFVGAQSQA